MEASFNIISCSKSYSLPFDEMPQPFCAKATWWGVTSWLNPPNFGQSELNRFIGKPIRFVARLVFQVAVMILSPLLGTPHHLVRSTISLMQYAWTDKINERARKYKALAWEHLKAAGRDFIAIVTNNMFAISPESGAANCASSSPVWIGQRLDSGEPLIVKYNRLVFLILTARTQTGLKLALDPQEFHSKVDCQIIVDAQNKSVFKFFAKAS